MIHVCRKRESRISVSTLIPRDHVAKLIKPRSDMRKLRQELQDLPAHGVLVKGSSRLRKDRSHDAENRIGVHGEGMRASIWRALSFSAESVATEMNALST